MPASGARFVTWFPWSRNDGLAANTMQHDFDTYVAAFISLAHANSAIPVLMTSIPDIGIANSTDDTGRLSVNSQVRALASTDVIVADVDAVMTDGASPARIPPALTSDGTHPSVAGDTAMAAVLAAAIQAYINSH